MDLGLAVVFIGDWFVWGTKGGNAAVFKIQGRKGDMHPV
jgi:hypothetical protein